jgi:hypothetical protein
VSTATVKSAGTARTVEVENVNHPGQVRRLDAEMHEAMARAMLAILPGVAPGLTIAELQDRVIAHLPERLFPQGARAGWWAKTVQLDLEAKGVIARERTTPLRLHRGRDAELRGVQKDQS